VNLKAVRAFALEAQGAVKTVRNELGAKGAGPIAVSGMLAEQLAKELGAGADPGAVLVGETVAGARAHIRIIAGAPSEDDDALVREAERAGVPVVIVQLWPQDDWRAPYVLSPFVVECRTGEGFPVPAIADLIAQAVEHPAALAARIPVLHDAVLRRLRRGAIVRSGLVGFLGAKGGATRPLLALEQVRVLGQLIALEPPEKRPQEVPVAAGVGAVTLAASYGLRKLARAARGRLPAPLADAAVAAAGTWLLSEALRRIEARGPANKHR
jgi:hypothetical protein